MKKPLMFLIGFLPASGIAVIVSFMYPKPETWILITVWLLAAGAICAANVNLGRPPWGRPGDG
jgi:hypothetical protein